MKQGIAIGFCLLLGCASATAHAGANDVRKTAEATMLVTGTVQANPDGTVNGYSLDQSDKLPASVVEAINRDMAHWTLTFDGKPASVITSKMSVRVVAEPIDDKSFRIVIAGESFGDYDNRSRTTLTYKARPAPSYPREAINWGVSGTAYLLIRVGRDGKVQELVAEQVNLDQYGAEHDMDRFRKMLADAALRAAKTWTFNAPTEGKDANAPYWDVRVPVVYDLGTYGGPKAHKGYGSWDVYIPGPRQNAPWVKDQALLTGAPDALPDGALQMMGSGPRLTSPPSGG
ncbi:energy transducer TonB [Dyella solisilvae]|uniref:Energy transducer TonB n=1 Tax=Dyella solisilvae TaxID=1920168 RepID=A0A370K4B4_9GAMM|nr:energy transducer TonB [Dyella solisilvae]RDI97257.1 energy transducer TonB [Dyella solisilvae]